MRAVREQRLVFGEVAELYDLARPSYPAPLVDDVVRMAGRSARAVDAGCGTGKATTLLAARGLAGVGVEADLAMAEVARRKLAAYPAWRVDVSDFERWQAPAGDGPFDLVCSAQAWHWLDPEARLRKAHNLLRAGGWLALWWNRPAVDQAPGGPPPGGSRSAAIRALIEEIYAEVAPEIAGTAPTMGDPQPPGERGFPPELTFSDPVRKSYEWSREYSADQWVALLRTQSDHRLLPPQRLHELTGRVHRVIDAQGGTYLHHYACWLWAAQKT
ncbi:MAG: class I SAM-dependent methyltransferase [Acidimicrobiales bacterium]